MVSVDFDAADDVLYSVALRIRAIDRKHLFNDLTDTITNTLHLNMESFNTRTERNIVICHIGFGVHSYAELRVIMDNIRTIPGVDEVRRLTSVPTPSLDGPALSL